MVKTMREKLAELLNSESKENGSDTPDFILSEYMLAALAAFDTAVTAREKWYGRNECGVEQPDPPARDDGVSDLADFPIEGEPRITGGDKLEEPLPFL